MELPQSRTFGAEGRKTTHDFLSLYSPVQQDPRHSQGVYFKTHDFLQPLEGVEKNVTKEENNVEVTIVERPPPPAPPPPGTRILPGGIGTYSISYYEQMVSKPEGSLFTAAQTSSAERNGENSNCSSYTGSGFALWDESASKKGKTRKENIGGEGLIHREASINLGEGQWATSLERTPQSSFSHKLNSTALSSLSSSLQQPSQKNNSYMSMITSSKIAQEEDDDEEEEEFRVKKELPSHSKGNLSVKFDGKGIDHQKPNTSRSKHSATEQRRRSKINDRFQRLREIIPHSDQKRDKASFLLEVVEYIQYLQERVQMYEESYPGWNHDPSKLMPLGKCNKDSECFIDQSRCPVSGSVQASMFAAKVDDNKAVISKANPMNTIAPKERCQQSELTNVAESYPLQQQQHVSPFSGTSNSAASLSPPDALDINKTALHFQSQLWPSRSRATEAAVASDYKLKEQEQAVETGTISISSTYSQGLLNSLTQSLQNSGVDLTEASISVQIDLGKRAKSRLYSSTSAAKDDVDPMKNQALSRNLTTDTALKRLKTSRS